MNLEITVSRNLFGNLSCQFQGIKLPFTRSGKYPARPLRGFTDTG